MGSSRKKGYGRAAAAAAAQQQWKVGDLVLAKLRGFPAWPAVISDPEKWGFAATNKKSFVYFYGTKQIAFCNYADIEVFTEEKKKCLLLKRQGKGDDFMRALDEIIDIYDTTKKQMLGSNSGDDEIAQSAEVLIRVKSSGNSSSLNEGIELETHIPSYHKLETAQSMVETSGRVDSEEVFTASTADDLQKNLAIDEPIASILDQLRQDPLATNTSLRKKRLRDGPQNGIVLQKGLPSLRTFRSLVADSSTFQESTSVYESGPSGTLVPEVINTESAESKSKQRLSHTFLSHDVNGPCTASPNGGSEDVGPQVSLKDYDDAIELNRSIIEPRCHLIAPKNMYFDSDYKLNGYHGSCMNDVVIKKKETTREHKDITKESSEVVLNRTPPSSPKEARVIIYEGDGDEHLPLVKRARVRMCKPNLEEIIVPPTHCEPVREDDKSETSSIMNNCDRHHASLSAEKSSPFSGSLLKINEELKFSLVNDCSSPSGNDPIFWKAKKCQLKDSVWILKLLCLHQNAFIGPLKPCLLMKVNPEMIVLNLRGRRMLMLPLVCPR